MVTTTRREGLTTASEALRQTAKERGKKGGPCPTDPPTPNGGLVVSWSAAAAGSLPALVLALALALVLVLFPGGTVVGPLLALASRGSS